MKECRAENPKFHTYNVFEWKYDPCNLSGLLQTSKQYIR